MNKLIPSILIIFTIALVACKPKEDSNIALYEVTKRDFIDAITARGDTDPLTALSINCPQRVNMATITWLIEDGTLVKEGDVIVRLESEELESQYDNLLTDLENLEAEIIKMRANQELQLALLDAQIKTNQAETQITALDSLQLLFTESNQKRIKELELEKSDIQNRRFQNKIKTTREIQSTEIRRREIMLQIARKRVEEAKERLEDLVIEAPRDGLFIISKNPMTWKNLVVGDNIFGGLTIATIPDLSQMQVIIKAPEDAYKRIQVGDSTLFQFDAMPGNFASGKILKKSPVGQPISYSSRIKQFEIQASVEKYDEIPKPGLSVRAHIIQRYIPDTIVIPNIAVFDHDSLKVVYVAQKKGFEMREVKTGINSSKDMLIVDGLHYGEVIALLKPKDKEIKKEVLLEKSSNKNNEKESQ